METNKSIDNIIANLKTVINLKGFNFTSKTNKLQLDVIKEKDLILKRLYKLLTLPSFYDINNKDNHDLNFNVKEMLKNKSIEINLFKPKLEFIMPKNEIEGIYKLNIAYPFKEESLIKMLKSKL